ncbi:metal ABC transporter solute-binding protein, Zn/Mn family [Peribacillus simplex]
MELIDSTHSDEHEHEGEETHSDELEHKSEETYSDDHEGEEGATEDHVHEDDGHDHGDLDPHVWLDPVHAIDLANNIKNSLSDKMPEHASDFDSNFHQLKSDLNQPSTTPKRSIY